MVRRALVKLVAKAPPDHGPRDSGPASWGPWSPRRMIGWGMLLSVLTRVLIIVAPGLPETGSFPDEGVVWRQAESLVEDGAYFCIEPLTPEVPRRAFRPPLLPALAALGLLLFGRGGAAGFVLAINALSGAALAFFTASLARRLAALLAAERGLPSLPWERGAVAVALLYGALSPLPLVFARYALTESLALALLAGASWLIFEALGHPGAALRPVRRRAIAAGALLGLAALTRASLLGLPLAFLVVATCWVGPRRAWRVAAPALVAFALVLAPWTLRNAAVLGAFVPVAVQGGEELYEACGPGATGAIRRDTMRWPRQVRGLDEVARDRLLWRLSLAHMARQGGEMLRLSAVKVARTWSPWANRQEYRHPAWNLMLGLEWAATLLPAAFGVWLLRRGGGAARALFVLTPAWYLAAVHAVFLGSVRYRVVAIGAFWPLAALAAAALLHRLCAMRRRRSPDLGTA